MTKKRTKDQECFIVSLHDCQYNNKNLHKWQKTCLLFEITFIKLEKWASITAQMIYRRILGTTVNNRSSVHCYLGCYRQEEKGIPTDNSLYLVITSSCSLLFFFFFFLNLYASFHLFSFISLTLLKKKWNLAKTWHWRHFYHSVTPYDDFHIQVKLTLWFRRHPSSL